MEQSIVHLESSKNRAWAVAACLGVVAVIEAFSISAMMPLKERVPYFIEADAKSGKVEASQKILDKFTPTEVNKIYFIRKFCENLFTMDSTRTKKYLLPEAASYTRGAATTQYKLWLEKDTPIERLVENPLLSRQVENFNINFVPDTDVAIVRFTLVTSTDGGLKKEDKSMSVKFALLEQEISETNPIGFFVTTFELKDEK